MNSEIITRVKASIIPEKKLINKNGKLFPLPKGLRTKINCYAYALGAMCPETSEITYQPGFTTGIEYEERNKEDFLQKMEQDLENLGFSYRRIPYPNSNFLEQGEYIVRVFFNTEDSECDGFHFMRKATKSGVWFHKEGWQNLPSLIKLNVVPAGQKGRDRKLFKHRVCPTSVEYAENNDIAKPIADYALKYNG